MLFRGVLSLLLRGRRSGYLLNPSAMDKKELLRGVWEALQNADLLDREGFEQAGVGARPSWRQLFEGARPPAQEDRRETEPGEWIHGWQFYASSTRENLLSRTRGN